MLNGGLRGGGRRLGPGGGGRFCRGRHLHGTEQDVRIAAFHARGAVHQAVAGEVFGEAEEKFAAEIGMGDLAAAELDDGFDAVAFLEETDGVVFLEVVVVVVGVRAEFEFLDLDHVLLLLGFVLFLFELVLIVPIIDRFGHGRHRGGRDNDEIETQFLRTAESGGGGHDFGGAIGEDCSHFPCTDRFVDVFSATGLSRREISAWNHAVSGVYPDIAFS